MSLDPLGLDRSFGDNQDCGLKSLFKFRDEFRLDLMEHAKVSIRNIDNQDVFLLSILLSFDFSSISNIKVLEFILETINRGFNFKKGLSNSFFNCRRLSLRRKVIFTDRYHITAMVLKSLLL